MHRITINVSWRCSLARWACAGSACGGYNVDAQIRQIFCFILSWWKARLSESVLVRWRGNETDSMFRSLNMIIELLRESIASLRAMLSFRELSHRGE